MPTEIYTLSLHDALPIYILMSFIHSFIHSGIYIAPLQGNYSEALPTPTRPKRTVLSLAYLAYCNLVWASRSEEHTSELQSQSNLVCRLLLEKKNTLINPA